MSLITKEFPNALLQNASALYNKMIAPRLTQKNKTIGISVAVALTLVYIIRDRVFKPPKNIRHIPYFGYSSVIKSLINGDSFFDRCYKVALPLLDSKDNVSGLYSEPGRSGWEIHVSNPEDAKRILLKHELFPKLNITEGNEQTLLTKFVGGPNVLLASGHEWKNQRKVTNPAFRRSLPVKLFGKITQELFVTMESMDETVNISDLLLRWTLEAIGRAGFDYNFHSLDNIENNKLFDYYTEISEGLKDLKFFVFPFLDQKLLWLFPKRRELHRKLDVFLDMLMDVIQNKREALVKGESNNNLEENERDLLTLMIESEGKGEGKLSDEELKGNLCLFFFAGHDTTASALSFAIYHLGKNPEIQQKARDEAIQILGDLPEDVLPTVEETKRMTYINQIMKETLRLNDPAPRVVPRKVTEDTVLSGTFIPKGSMVTVNIYNVHHVDKIWKDSAKFNPDRFAEDGEADRDAGEGMAWLPFGNGARQCLGMNFSLNEQRVLLSMLLRKFTWTIPENSKHKDGLITAGFPVTSPTDLDITFHKRY